MSNRVLVPVNPLDESEGWVEVDAMEALEAYSSYYRDAQQKLAIERRLSRQLAWNQASPARPWWYYGYLGFCLGVIVANVDLLGYVSRWLTR